MPGQQDVHTGPFRFDRPADRPELRRPRLDELRILRIRVDLDGAEPPIWRRLDLRSDLTLDVVHQVLQVGFGWEDSHLHRFALGGNPFEPTSQIFLCPFEVEEGDLDDEGGVAASSVRLDETLQEPGDVMAYVYDYGDGWELTLRVEEVLPAQPDAPTAVVLAGGRAAPPEDSGGRTDEAGLAEVLDDPAHVDLSELNRELRGPYFALRGHGLHPRLVDLACQLRHTTVGAELILRCHALVERPTRPTDDELRAALRAYIWFLDRAQADGIGLTAAGYLRPADAEAAAEVLPAAQGWIGKRNRESHLGPLLMFRRSLTALGLLRKSKGKLVLTRVGVTAQRDPELLWQLLADRLVPAEDGFDRDATLLVLAYAATSAGEEIPLDQIAETLTELGWRASDGDVIESYDLFRLAAWRVLDNVTTERRETPARRTVSPVTATLARAALLETGTTVR